MNAREVLQALLDGKILTESFGAGIGRLIRLNKNGDIETLGERGMAVHRVMPCITFENTKIWENYPLTFVEAMKALAEGHSVESERSKAIFFAYNGKMYARCEGDDDDEVRDITTKEISGMWRLVE